MLFQSLPFLVFFVTFLVALPLFHGLARCIYVTVASYIFYAWWEPRFVPVLLLLTLFAHHFANRVHLNRHQKWIVVALGLVPLALFKYTNFILENFARLSGFEIHFHADWRLPLGISFITFTVIAYILDIQSGRTSREGRFWYSALYIAFFPHLIAGPILRARKILPQLPHLGLNRRALKFSGLLFSLGIFKKVVIADQIAPHVEQAFRGLTTLTQGEALLAFYGFTIQIYCDFSGYSDMAMALALLLGVRFPINFNSPYLSASFREFWRRWHISLSQWLRDYLYIPLGGGRGSLAQTLFTLFTTMLIGGLWHGAAWTFVLWGGLHGLFLVVEAVGRHWRIHLPRWLRILLVVHGVGALWILFRAPDVTSAARLILSAFSPGDVGALLANPLPVLLIFLTWIWHPYDNPSRVRWLAHRIPSRMAYPGILMLILVCAAMTVENPSAFIYFDF
ncbi:MAG: MBOAT family protein [Magnetococcales bacterium]|nr:MBOAT family protein [Magnetococcales bacterium]MBF0321345.1 MBOAT family protein [Magnetococcales bacterium]